MMKAILLGVFCFGVQAVEVSMTINGKDSKCPPKKSQDVCIIEPGDSKSFKPKDLGVDCENHRRSCDGYTLDLTFELPPESVPEMVTISGRGWIISNPQVLVTPNVTTVVRVTCEKCHHLDRLKIKSEKKE